MKINQQFLGKRLKRSMIWKIDFNDEADKNLAKLNPHARKILRDYLDNRILKLKHPKDTGKALTGNYRGLWRYRVDKFRIICRIQEDKLIVLVVKIGKRDEVYED